MTLRTRTRVGILQEVWLTLARPLRVSLYRFRNEYAVKLVPLTRERRQEASSFILREKTGPLVLLIEEKHIPRGNSLLGLCLLSSLSLYHPIIQCSYCSCRYTLVQVASRGQRSFPWDNLSVPMYLFGFISDPYLFDSFEKYFENINKRRQGII